MGMNLRHNIISQGSVGLHSVIKWIRWSHCINNTLSIQYSKCVNRGERLAESSPQAVTFLWSFVPPSRAAWFKGNMTLSLCVCFTFFASLWSEDEAANIAKSSCYDAEHPVPVLLVSPPQAVNPAWPTKARNRRQNQTSYSQMSSDDQFAPVTNSTLDLLIPVKVSGSQSFHILQGTSTP